VTSATGGALEGFIDALLEDDSAELYDRAPCGYLSTDPDGLIVKANQTFLTMTGHQRGDLVGKRRFADLLSAGGRIYHETHYAPMLMMQGTARAIAFELVTRDGGRLPVLVNSVLDRDPAGAPIVVRVAVFDATDRREYERELLRASSAPSCPRRTLRSSLRRCSGCSCRPRLR
jgi:sigma-B regulation protein RsbU (phosphoserine phosphatase)